MDGISGYSDDLLSLLGGEKSGRSNREIELEKACNDFEAVLATTLLKEGMKTAKEIGKGGDGDEEDSGSSSYQEMAHEQIATYIGSQGMMGLGKMLYESLRHRLEDMNKLKEVTGEMK